MAASVQADIYRISDGKGGYNTFYPDTPNNRKVMEDGIGKIKATMGNKLIPCLFITLFIGSAAYLTFSCLITNCFDSSQNDAQQHKCEIFCDTPTKIWSCAGTIIGLIGTTASCCYACYKK